MMSIDSGIYRITHSVEVYTKGKDKYLIRCKLIDTQGLYPLK